MTSCLPIPSLDAKLYGLIEEDYAHDSFQLLIACIFLNRTKGAVAKPYIESFFSAYPTPEKLAHASPTDTIPYFAKLGLQNQRSKSVIELARRYVADPPQRDVLRSKGKSDRYKNEVSEVAHLPGVGKYASDAWRIFCRDGFYDDAGLESWKEVELEVKDKELLAYVKWRRRKEDTAVAALAKERQATKKGLITSCTALADEEGNDNDLIDRMEVLRIV